MGSGGQEESDDGVVPCPKQWARHDESLIERHDTIYTCKWTYFIMKNKKSAWQLQSRLAAVGSRHIDKFNIRKGKARREINKVGHVMKLTNHYCQTNQLSFCLTKTNGVIHTWYQYSNFKYYPFFVLNFNYIITPSLYPIFIDIHYNIYPLYVRNI